jgi:hypothetical protein
MKKILCVLGLFIVLHANAQFVGTPYLTTTTTTTDSRLVLDQLGVNPSFAFSTRKLRTDYLGFAIRLRRSTDNAQVDVTFDTNGIISDNSDAKIAVSGTSGLAVNTILTLSSFRGAATLFVTIWYDQGANGYHGVQPTTGRQPVFSLGVAGLTNQYASLLFTGTAKHNVTVNQAMPVLLGSGLRGSVMMLAKVQAGVTTSNSFGHSDSADNNKRWSAHMNWPTDNNYMYTDLGSSTGGTRSFLNDATVGFNKYKQYTIVRNTDSKIVRVSGIDRNNITSALTPTSVTWSAGSTFGVGLTTGSLDTGFNQNGFTGNISEFILFPEPLTTGQYWFTENNQILFWGAY